MAAFTLLLFSLIPGLLGDEFVERPVIQMQLTAGDVGQPDAEELGESQSGDADQQWDVHNLEQPDPEARNSWQPEQEIRNSRQLESKTGNLSQTEAGKLLQPEPEAGNLLQPELQARNLSQPDPETGNLLQPEPEAANLVQPELQAGNLSQPDPEAGNLLQPELEAGNSGQVESEAGNSGQPDAVFLDQFKANDTSHTIGEGIGVNKMNNHDQDEPEEDKYMASMTLPSHHEEIEERGDMVFDAGGTFDGETDRRFGGQQGYTEIGYDGGGHFFNAVLLLGAVVVVLYGMWSIRRKIVPLLLKGRRGKKPEYQRLSM